MKFLDETIEVDESGLSYEFNILLFGKKDENVYSASDSGCSCPSPFEEIHSVEEMERVQNLAYAKQLYDNFRKRKYGEGNIEVDMDWDRLEETLKGWGLQ